MTDSIVGKSRDR